MPSFAEIQNMTVGIWDCVSGVSGTEDFGALAATAGQNVRIQSITAIAGENGATVTIDNRDPIIIPAGQAITLTPRGTIHNNVIVFAGTLGYVVEYATNNFFGQSKGDI